MSDSRTGAGKMQINWEHFVGQKVRKYSNTKRIGAWQKDTGANLKEYPMTKAGTI